MRTAARLLLLITFAVLAACGGGSTTETPSGSLVLRTVTGGHQLDPNGYSLTTPSAVGIATIGANTSTRKDDLPPGDYPIVLGGMAANCHAPATSDTGHVVDAGIDTVMFTVTCDTTFGAIAVTAATTGGTPDPNGYFVQVNGGASGSVPSTGTLSVGGLSPDTYTVTLAGLASNCAFVGASADTVAVTAGNSVGADFELNCPSPGVLAVNATTTGVALDPDGYSLIVDGGAANPMVANGSAGPLTLSAGDHSVALRGIVMNCTLTGDSTRTAALTPGDTLTLSFAVDCAHPAVAFARGASGESYSIWAMNPDGTNEVTVAPYATLGGGRAPTWSPDRQQLIYQTSGSDVSTGLSRVNADGSGHISIYDSAGAMAPRWSGANDRIVFIRRNPFAPFVANSGRVTAVDPDGSDMVELLPDTVGSLSADWSPTGDRVAIARFAPNGTSTGMVGIWILTVATDSMVQIVADTFNSRPVRWAPTGETIAFRCPGLALCTVNANGTGAQRLTLPELPVGEFSWSPDGTRIVWASGNIQGGVDAVSWVVGAGTWTRLPSGPANRIDPAWH